MKACVHCVVENFDLVLRGGSVQVGKEGKEIPVQGDSIFACVSLKVEGEEATHRFAVTVGSRSADVKPYHFVAAINAVLQAIGQRSESALDCVTLEVAEIGTTN